MKKIVIALSVTTVLAACDGGSSEPRMDWAKSGAGEPEKVTALSDCRYQIRINKVDEDEQDELLKLCMQGKGFRYQTIEQ